MSTAKFDTWMNPDGTTNYKCRAWVNFDGTTTVPTIRASGNVSSITDAGVGVYFVNFMTAMPDANYASPASTSNDGVLRVDLQATTSCRVVTSTATADAGTVTVAIFR